MSQQETTGWQPIETAPRDERVLLSCGGVVVVGSYSSWSCVWLRDGAATVHPSNWLEPTAWQPLPEPFHA